MRNQPAQPTTTTPIPTSIPTSIPASIPASIHITKPAAFLQALRAPFTLAIWHRPNRVIALVAVVVLFSLADLYMTLTHVATIGMLEGNPLARWIMRNLDPVAVILWKAFTLLVAGSILIKLRRKACGELAAWICAAILVWLMFRWVGYAEDLSTLSADEWQLVQETNESQWVMPPS